MINISNYFADKESGRATLSVVQADFPEAARVIVTRIAYNTDGERADQVEYMTLAEYNELFTFVTDVEAVA